ncbi:MAG: TIGR02147 family protein [Bacteriovoracia bacterium]
MIQGSGARPAVFDYIDFRVFLNDFFRYSRRVRKSFSFRSFAKAAGYSSPSTIQMVIQGKRNLSPNGAEKTAAALGLNGAEKSYFLNLVAHNQSDNDLEKASQLKILRDVDADRQMGVLQEAQVNYFSRWYYLAIREMIGKPGFSENPAWLARQLNPPITVEEAKCALHDLLTLGIVKRGADGQLAINTRFVFSPEKLQSPLVSKLQQQMIQLSLQALDRLPKKERSLTAATLAVSAEGERQIRELIDQFQQQLVQIVSRSEGTSFRIMQLNLQLFPVSFRLTGEGEGSGEGGGNESAA